MRIVPDYAGSSQPTELRVRNNCDGADLRRQRRHLPSPGDVGGLEDQMCAVLQAAQYEDTATARPAPGGRRSDQPSVMPC